MFVYDAREDFFGALGPGAREWFGAATFPPSGPSSCGWARAGGYLETTVVHEVTHVVFSDSTENAFHQPAKWLNEGLATWSEAHSADAQRATVESEASEAGLFSFDAITYDFPYGTRGSTLSYAMGTTMVDMIIDAYGEDAIAEVAAAYRAGASTMTPCRKGAVAADEMYADFYATFGSRSPARCRPPPSRHRTSTSRPGGARPGRVRVEPPP